MTNVTITRRQFIEIVQTITDQNPEWTNAIILAAIAGLNQRIHSESVSRVKAEAALIMAYDLLDSNQVNSTIESAVVDALLIQGTEYQRRVAERQKQRNQQNS